MRVLCALSGGVDSAVAAARLVRDGHDVVGVHLRTGVEADGQAAGGTRSCCGADDARDARQVAAALDIPFYVVDVADAFRAVTDDFVAAYASGATPNPCVICNKEVKFGRLVEIARGLGAAAVATGHYARLETRADGRVRLRRAVDASKDQSYVLYPLSQAQLAAARFPLGDTPKEDIRREAEALDLHVAGKRDSQDLCFVPDGDYRRYLAEHAPDVLVPGEVVDETGRVVGTHDGAAGYTIGQRRRLPAMGTPHYVKAVDAEAGRVTIAGRDALEKRVVGVVNVNWVDCDAPEPGASFAVHARIRHAGAAEAGTLRVLPHGQVEVHFDAPVFAPARGQALVAYVENDVVLCGGTILAARDEVPASDEATARG
ncbi:MAG: tRNA 2-thiouridine(34) synthase MnmA [Planctomycetota bacterium]|nr:tRNA 2-thiouridine(34) synthase MnmA [Planctomycetota bacterium]